MTPYDKLFLAGYFLVVILVQCYWQRALIKSNRHISHFWHGMVYVFAICPAIWLFWPIWWQVAVIGILARLAFFDFTLNIIRGKPLFYNGKGTTDSIIDKIENNFSVFWVNVLKLAMVAAFIMVIIKIK